MADRIEHDSMGPVSVPADALYGAQTRRAVDNFRISGWRLPAAFVHALGRIKRIAAEENRALGLLDDERAGWIVRAADEVAAGDHDEQFVLDVFQTGSGTSTHMNANEVIANRAIQLAGGEPGSRDPVHPNDHVNLGQSSNDVIPTAMHVAVAVALHDELRPALAALADRLRERAARFDDVVKVGRTHLQDATPVRVGQVLRGYAAQLDDALARIDDASRPLFELPVGGTAVGTAINTAPEFGARVARRLAEATGLPFVEARDHLAAQGAKDAAVGAAGALKGVALALNRIANDIRWLASGPHCGLGELVLPAVQPGSSIMPGKVNPVICESVMQAAAWVVGADASISFAAATLSNFELCTAFPLMTHQLLESCRLLTASARNLEERAIRGLQVDRERCASLIEGSLAMVTGLAPVIGYDAAAAIAKRAHAEGRTVRDVARELGVVDDVTLDRLLDPRSMTGRR